MNKINNQLIEKIGFYSFIFLVFFIVSLAKVIINVKMPNKWMEIFQFFLSLFHILNLAI